MPENHVLMAKDGTTLHVHAAAVADHKRLGWSVIDGKSLNVEVRVMDFPEVQAMTQKATELAALLDEKDARIAELEAALAEHEADPATDDLKARIADLEAKKAAGTLGKTEPALLARLQNKLAKLEGKA